jgi:ribosomal protein S18 acetylase RimI-like enzyme
MGIASSVSRLMDYRRRHGFVATMRRVGLALRRAVFSSRMVVFYCDLGTQAAAPLNIPNSLKLDRLTSYSGLSQLDLQDMISFWNPKLAHRNIRERFEKGASLWLVRSGDKLAGYGWTLQGRTIESYYFPLAPEDVHLFDFHVFPQYRGQKINPLLVTHILHTLATMGGGRAFIEAAEWNEPQLASLQKTALRRLGLARSFTILGHTFTCWVENEIGQQLRKGVEGRDGPAVVAGLHEQ